MDCTARVPEGESRLFYMIPAFASVSLEIRYLNSQKNKDQLLSFNESFVHACEEKELAEIENLMSSKKIPVLIYYATRAVEAVMNDKVLGC